MVVRGKRCLKPNVCLGNWYLKDFVCPKSWGANQILEVALKDIVANMNRYMDFITDPGYGFTLLLIHRVWDYQIRMIKYCPDTKDKTDMDVEDFWFHPDECALNGCGDCEDKSALLTSAVKMAIKLGMRKDIKVYHCIGYYTPIVNGVKKFYGHGFPLLVVGDKVLWIESTFDEPLALCAWMVFDHNLLLPVVYTDGKSDYMITVADNPFGIPKSYINEYLDQINAMIGYVQNTAARPPKSSEVRDLLLKDARRMIKRHEEIFKRWYAWTTP